MQALRWCTAEGFLICLASSSWLNCRWYVVKKYFYMFDGADFPKPLDEELFDSWLENGRQSKLSYSYLLIIWDELDSAYQAVYVESRDELNDYANNRIATGRERLVAAYDLYSESRII